LKKLSENFNLKTSPVLIQNQNNESEKENKLKNERQLIDSYNQNIQNVNNNKMNDDLLISPSPYNENYQEITTDRITDSEYEEMLIQYPKLEDGINVEQRNPQENIMGNGMLIRMFVMEEEYKYGQMERNIQVIGKMIKQKEKENYFMLMEMYMKVIGSMTNQMDLVFIHIQMVQGMKENGKMINRMEEVRNFGLMVLYMMENIKMVKKMAKVNFLGQTEQYIQEILRIII